jgi:hypothetical protein
MKYDIEIYILLIQGLWALLMALAGFFIYEMRSTLREIEKNTNDLHDRLLSQYVTKPELRERVHGVRGALGMHSTWIHILAQKAGIALPGQAARNNDGE